MLYLMHEHRALGADRGLACLALSSSHIKASHLLRGVIKHAIEAMLFVVPPWICLLTYDFYCYLQLLTSLADDTGGYNGLVFSPAGEGPVNGPQFDAMHKELADLCSSINKVKKEIKQNSKTTIVRDRPAKPENRSPYRASFSLSPGSVDGSAALRQTSSSPLPRQPSAATKSRAQSPVDGRKRLDPIPQDRISSQRTLVFTVRITCNRAVDGCMSAQGTAGCCMCVAADCLGTVFVLLVLHLLLTAVLALLLQDEKSNIPACQVTPFHEGTVSQYNSMQYLPPMKQKRGDVPTSSSLLHSR